MKIILGQAYSFSQDGERDIQEDSRYPSVDKPDKGQRFFLVCDGVGGCNKGEVASQTVCETFGKALAHAGFEKDFTNKDFQHVLDKAYDALDKKSDDDNEGMATTLTFVCFHQGGCTMAHIGDSRIYHIRPTEGILYRSDDHSLVNELVHHGVISPDEAIDHPRKNVITRYMEAVDSTQNRSMATVMRTTNIMKGDYFFLCSDGVLCCVDEDELIEILSDSGKSDEEKLAVIAQKSVNSQDNNTAYLIPVAEVEGEEQTETEDEPTEEHGTRMLRSPQAGTEDIESVQTTWGDSVKQWLKNLFN